MTRRTDPPLSDWTLDDAPGGLGKSEVVFLDCRTKGEVLTLLAERGVTPDKTAECPAAISSNRPRFLD